MKVVNKKQLITAVGWTALIVGAYMIYLGSDGEIIPTNVEPNDDVIDAEFTIVE